jgi:cyclase
MVVSKVKCLSLWRVAGIVIMAGCCSLALGQEPAASDAEVEVVPIRDGMYMLGSDAGNVTLQIGRDGVLLVDTMSAKMGPKVLAAVRKLSDKPIRYVLNTSAHPDSVGGNAVIAAAGSTITGGNVNAAIDDVKVGAAVMAHENVLSKMNAENPPLPFEALPTSTYFTDRKDFFFNGEGVQLQYQPNATTNGDSIVVFERSSVISAGQLFALERYPIIDTNSGGSLRGIIKALNHIIDLTIPESRQDGGTIVIPAYGRVCNEAEVVEYRDMLTIISDSIQEMIKEGRSLKQVVDARPTQAYDVRYGTDSGPWTTKMFVETVYRELKSSGSKGR